MKLPGESIRARLRSAEDYLRALRSSLQQAWSEQYAAFLGSNLSLEQALALVHPWHYEDNVPRERILGSRAFEISTPHGSCQATLIWGYECKWGTEEGMVADHLWPWSLGGPTVGSNLISLCRFHNQLKGNDVHLFPWESPPHWLPGTLKLINSALRHKS